MKILRIEADHYKNFPHLCFDFIPKARKTEEDKTYELYESVENLYSFNTISVVGKNSSGKTSILKLINSVYDIFELFRLEDDILSLAQTSSKVVFYHNNFICSYSTTLEKQTTIGNALSFTNEKIYKKPYHKSKISTIFEFSEAHRYLFQRDLLPDDTSSLFHILKQRNDYATYCSDEDINHDLFHVLFTLYNQLLPQQYLNRILSIFDDNMDDLQEISKDLYLISYANQKRELSSNQLLHFLSSGTFKGLYLYTAAIISLLNGTTMIIDEIENHFHKTLVENLIMLFKDKKVNKHGATLLFSTHYCELLDLFSRSDNIWITKADQNLKLYNMYEDFSIRNDVLKSKKFYDDTFGTSVNYEALMDLKRDLIQHE